jgi:hypothetical protein
MEMTGPEKETRENAPRMRWLWLGGSIVSDRANSQVGLYRHLIRALTKQGQDITYLEPADHPAFVEALKREGSGFYRAFLLEFPDIRYRRYDMPRSHERDVWLGREAALVDVVVIESGAPSEVLEWLERVPERSFITVKLDDSSPGNHEDIDVVWTLSPNDHGGEPFSDLDGVKVIADELLSSITSARPMRRQKDLA